MRLPFDTFEGGNLYAENAAGVALNHFLVLEHFTPPQPEEGYQSVELSGTNGSIDIPTNSEPLTAPWKTHGIQRETLKLFHTPRGQRRKFTYFGVLADQYAAPGASEKEKQIVATLYGRLNVKFSEFKGAVGTDYEIKSISKYVLQIGNEEIFRFDIEQGGWLDPEGQRLRFNNMVGAVG